jgi:hypothetical protein
MRKLYILILICLLALSAALSGCIGVPGTTVGSGHPETRQYDLSGFTGVDAASAFRVTITQSSNYAVAVTADDNILDHVQVTKSGGLLKLNLQGLYSNVHLSAEISMPTLERLNLSGASQATLKGEFSADTFDANLSGASSADGAIEANTMNLVLSGASKITLSGSATKSLTVRGSGASRFSLGDLAAGNADINLNGASSCDVEVNGTLTANVSGASNLTYSGNPELGKITESGASSVRRR